MKIKIKVHAGSSKEEIKQVSNANWGFEIWVREKAVDDKANMKIVKILKKYFRKPVRIVSGFTSRIKAVEVEK